MAWPTTPVATGELITAAQLNFLPVRLADVTLGADTATIDFSSIPSIYAHLVLECYLRGSFANPTNTLGLRFNNDSTANYDYQAVRGAAATVSAFEAFAQGFAHGGDMPGSTALANLFAGFTILIPHYTNSANNKASISQCSLKTNTTTGTMYSEQISGFWRSNAAINRVTLFSQTGGNLVTGSRATLYGLAG